jgi:hypothetical protein
MYMSVRWEYRTTFEREPDREETLNELGDLGWELCGVYQGHGGVAIFYWKRRLPNDFVEPKHDPVEPITPGPQVDFNWRDHVLTEHFGDGQQEHSAVMEAAGH